MCEKMLRYMVQGFDGAVSTIAAIPSSDIFYVSTQPYGSHDFANGVFSWAIFDQCSLGCVHIHVTIVDICSLVSASATWLRKFLVGIRICYVQGVCRAVIKDRVMHAVFVDYEEMRVNHDNEKWTEVSRH